ncbi:MAG: DUF3014 domain-containing protein [Pseudomonadales bacterium]|nr:DUF3014 domain-containing protein [Pseudomonadales bacterium]
MPTAIEKQMKEMEERSSAQVESIEGERRYSKPAKLDVSTRSIRYILSISVVLVVAVYFAADRWEQVQNLFQKSSGIASLVAPLMDAADSDVEIVASAEPLSGSIERQPAPVKTVEPVDVRSSIDPLPALGESDDLYRELWIELWADNKVVSWSGTEQLVRKATAIMDNLAQGEIVQNLLGVFALESPFMVELLQSANVEEGSVDVYLVDPASYQRYTPLVNSIVVANTSQLLNFYVRLRPLFQTAYLELGYPTGHVDNVLIKTLQNIQAAPVLENNVRLIQPKVMYQFEDEELEKRSVLEKQLFRMGPENMRLLQKKAKELEVALSEVLR